MSDWRRQGGGEPPDKTKIVALGALAVGALVFFWLGLSRSDEEKVSSSGFSENGGGPGSFSSERRGQTGLAMVRVGLSEPPNATAPESLTPGASGAAAATSYSAPQQPAGVAASTGAPSAPPDPADAARLAALGVPTDKNALKALGDQHGLLSRLTNKVLGYPPAVKFLLNNKLIVDGLFSRDTAKRNCESASSLTSYMMNGKDPNGVSEDTPILQALMQHPDSAAEAANSEFAKRVMACPSVQALQQNPAGLAQVVVGNPGLLGIVTDPAATAAVAGNPQASALFSEAVSAVAGGGGLGGGSSQ